MKFLKNPVAMTVALCVSSGAFAQQAIDTITVTASPIIESNQVDNFSGFSTQVTDAQIKDLGALDLAAALRMTPGVQISRYNEVGSYSGGEGGNVYIRGLGASRPGSEIKTYLDGVPVYMGIWNHPMMDMLPLNGVGAVSVLKGPNNMSSGNNFASINLQTKRATQDGVQGEVDASTGSFATNALRGNLVGRKDDVDFMFAAGSIGSDGDRANSDAKLNNAMGRIAKQIDRSWAVGASFLAVNNKVGDPGDNRYAPFTAVPRPQGMDTNGIARNDSATNMLTAFLTHQHGDWRGEFKVYENHGYNDLTNDPAWGTFKSGYKMTGFRWKEEFSPWKGGNVVAGVDQESISGTVAGQHVGTTLGTPVGFVGPVPTTNFGIEGSAEVPSFKVASAYAGANHKINLANGWVMQPSVGVRFYNSTYYESKAAPNAGVSLISDEMIVYANYTEALLYPGAETYAMTRATPFAFTANTGWNSLSPAEDKHTEIGMKWSVSSKTQIDFSVFEDEISKRYVWAGFNMGASGAWSNSFPTYKVNGAELSVKHEINSQWVMFGGVTQLDSTLSNLPYAPKTALASGLIGTVGGYRLALDAQHQTSMYSQTQDRGNFSPNLVGSLTVANARVGYPMASLGKRGEVYAAINNLFDANYQYNAGYPMAGRNFRIGLIASF
jgi:outer membrane cobalamin receptor